MGLSFSAALLALAAGGYAVDRLLSRPSRVAVAARTDAFLSARDAFLRFEHDTGALPATLQDLVPRYLRRDEIESEAGPLYRYDARRRYLAMAAGATIRGIVPRTRAPLEFDLPPPGLLQVSENEPPATNPPPRPGVTLAAAVEPAESPDLPHATPPEGALVMEAEHWSEMNYAWEIHPDPACGGGAHIVCKEGTIAGSSQSSYGFFDFYDPEEKQEQTVLKYHFRITKAGPYYLFGRLWATCSHCSNNINIGIDRGGLMPSQEKDYYGEFMGCSVPFRWVWTRAMGGAAYLAAGDHYIHVIPHEDGLQLDQFMLSPEATIDPQARNMPFKANTLTNHDTAFEKTNGPPVHLSFDVDSRVFTAAKPCRCRLMVRRLRPAAGSALLKVLLRSAGKDGSDFPMGERTVDLAGLPELGIIDLDFSGRISSNSRGASIC